ncbi:hypothetical protein BOX15_Mlig002840g1 [Macrostomum lignano]|uniref:non-specific serine/threonine protein kinase n=1 Tax=Macrostomum lignano TaxID=282301 RepID=A0A267DM98_9PLAT|nr:hypothetical protein BOX15_Mlig002840g1 [Macrostomum lignano]
MGKDTGSLRVTVLDKPGPCTGPLEATDIDANQVTLKWAPPKSDGGEPVSNYVLEKRIKGTDEWLPVSSFLSSPTATVKNLEEGKPYEFRVMAENAQGRGEPLQTISPVTPKLPFEPPSACNQPAVEEVTADSVALSWQPPRNNGGSPVTGYIVEKRAKGDKSWSKASVTPVSSTNFTAKNLPEGKEFEFRVTPVNKAGPGEPSEPTDAVKVQAPQTAPRILSDFATKDVTAAAGEEFKLRIPFEGSPPENVECFHGATAVPVERFEIREETSEVVIVCKKAVKADEGKYTVTLKNRAGRDSIEPKVNIVDKPAMPEGPLEVSKIGPDSCTLTWRPPKDDGGAPVENYVVEKQDPRTGEWVPLSKFVRKPEYEAFGLDEGKPVKFRVRAENLHGLSEPLELETAVTPKLAFQPPGAPEGLDVTGVDESSVSLSWKKPRSDGGNKVQGYVVEYKEPSSNKWKKANDFPVKGNKMTVPGLDKNTKYEFRVRAKNDAGLGEPSAATKPVETKSKISPPGNPGTPAVTKTGKNFAELEWTKPLNEGGGRLTGFKVEKRKKNGDWETAATVPGSASDALIDGLDEDEEYEFRVTALNASGEGDPSPPSLPTKIEDRKAGASPEFLSRLQAATGAVGGSATFTCRIDGKPPPEVRWFKNGIELRPSARAQISSDGEVATLTLNDLSESDAGEITCELANKAGRECTSARLNVQRPPKLERAVPDQSGDVGDGVKFKVFFSGNGPLKLGLKKGSKDLSESPNVKLQEFDDYVVVQIKDLQREDAGDYKLELANESGSTAAPFSLKVKAKPSAAGGPLQASDVTKNACKLSWKPPRDDGGSKVTHYVVERKEKDKENWLTVASFCKDTSVDVQGLVENSEYSFRVFAVNENGSSEPLETTGPIVAKMPFDKPQAPGEPEAEEVGADFVSLSWSRPVSDGGGKITGYYVEKREAGASDAAWTRVNFVPIHNTTCNIPNLIEDKDYEFRVFAENEAGLSQPSGASRKVTVKDPKAQSLPQFTTQLKRQQVNEGKRAEFEVQLNGSPPFDVVWSKGVRELAPSGKYDIGKEGDRYYLVVNNCSIDDADEYSVRVSNRAGRAPARPPT